MDSTSSEDRDFILWVLLRQARDAVFKVRENELRQYGISTIEAATLYAIQSIGDKATPAEISRWVFREHHTVSALLSRMQKKGLVTKTKDTSRKNIWRVSLTKKGKNAYRQSIKRESIHTALSPLSAKDRQRLESYLREIRDNAIKHSVSEPALPFP